MNSKLNPDNVHPPLGRYAHTVKVSPGADWLVVSGQVGMTKAGKLANGVERQTAQAFKNVVACLKANGMTQDDLVKITVYLTDSRHVDGFRAGRDQVLKGNSLLASTLVIVSGLAAPEICVEIEATAAKVSN
jgi:enamine deaminase RidA (YjgF/YER057c/UK114 family)